MVGLLLAVVPLVVVVVLPSVKISKSPEKLQTFLQLECERGQGIWCHFKVSTVPIPITPSFLPPSPFEYDAGFWAQSAMQTTLRSEVNSIVLTIGGSLYRLF